MSTITTNPTCNKPGFATHFASFVTEESAEVADTASLICDWGQYLSDSASDKIGFAAHGRTFDTIKKFHAIPGLVKNLGDLRKHLDWRSKSDTTTEIDKQLILDSAMTVKNGAETGLFLHQTHIIDLQDLAPTFSGAFWGGLGVHDGYKLIVTHPDDIREAEKIVEHEKDVNLKGWYQWKVYSSYIEVAKSVMVVAMAVISLITLVVTTPIDSIIFSPGFFLGLATIWTVLNLFNYFYSRIIDVEVKSYKPDLALTAV